MKIEILGMGCHKCKKLYETVCLIAKEMNAAAEVLKVEDLGKIMEYGIMSTPAVAVNGEIKTSGKIPGADEIRGWLTIK